MAQKGKADRRIGTFPERMQMHELIMQNSDELDGDPKQRRWHEGWDFDVVALKVAPDLKGHHARFVTQELGIQMEALTVGPQPGATKLLKDQVAQLAGRMDSFQDQLNVMRSKADAVLQAKGEILDVPRVVTLLKERLDKMQEQIGDILRQEANANRGDGKALRKAQAMEQRLNRLENWARAQGYSH